jgi:hypothetical protein
MIKPEFSNNQGPPVTDICAATPDRNVEIFKSLWVRVFFSLVFFAQNGSFILDTMVFLFLDFSKSDAAVRHIQ